MIIDHYLILMRATSFVPSTLALTLRRSARVLARAPTRAGAPVDHTTTSMNNLPSPTDSPCTPSARARRRAIPSGCGSPDGVHARPPLVELHGGDDGETLGGGLKHASVATTVSETLVKLLHIMLLAPGMSLLLVLVMLLLL